MADTNNIFVFVIICLISITGFACALISLRIIYKRAVLHNAFGYICAAHIFAEAGILLCFISWSAPIILVDSSLSESSIFGVIFGLIINWLFYSSFIFQFVKSVNRLCATVFYIRYRAIFSISNAKILIGIVSVTSICIISPLFKYECNLLFDAQIFAWQIRDESCAPLFGSIDFAVTAFTPALAFSCDIITFCFLRFKLNNQSKVTLSRDIRFFAQTCVSTLLYIQIFVTFYFVAPLASTTWTIFVSTTMTWLLGHTLNLISFILFNSVFTSEQKVMVISSMSPGTRLVTRVTHA